MQHQLHLARVLSTGCPIQFAPECKLQMEMRTIRWAWSKSTNSECWLWKLFMILQFPIFTKLVDVWPCLQMARAWQHTKVLMKSSATMTGGVLTIQIQVPNEGVRTCVSVYSVQYNLCIPSQTTIFFKSHNNVVDSVFYLITHKPILGPIKVKHFLTFRAFSVG